VSDWYPPESIHPSDDVEPSGDHTTDSESPLREGLPPTYTMRHDRHYVDELSSPSKTPPVRMLRVRDIKMGETADNDLDEPFVESVRRVGIVQPVLVRRRNRGYELIAGAKRLAAAIEADLTELPCRICDVDDREALELAEADDLRGRVAQSQNSEGVASKPSPAPPLLASMLTEVADGLDAALACWRMSTERPDWSYAPTLSRLTHIEMQRVKRLADGLRVLTDPVSVTKTSLDLVSLVRDMSERTEQERRLVDVHLASKTETPVIQVRGNEPLLLLALEGALQALTALVAEIPDKTIRLVLRAERSVATVELSCPTADVSKTLVARFFDQQLHERPGGYGAAVSLSAAKRVVELHDGQASVQSLLPAGCRVTLTIPL